jgi:hypothetical protein
LQIDFVSLKNKKNETFGKGLMSKITDLWKDEILGCINKNTTGITNTGFCMLSTMAFFIDASRLVLEWTESSMAHDGNLNPHCKDRKLQHKKRKGAGQSFF